jgi:hypothetical protein
MKTAAFLSYAHADRATAAVIEELLRRRGVVCWVDHRGIAPGARFDREIERAIVRSGAVVWLVSAESVRSDYVKYELTTALHHGRPILPVRLEAIDLAHLPAPLNLKLGNVQAWDFFALPPDDLGTGLADGVHRLVLHNRRKALGRLGVLAAAVGLVGTVGTWQAYKLGRSSAADVPLPRPVPARLAGMPIGDVIKILYQESPLAASSATVRAALNFSLEARRQGERDYTRLPDGGVLASEVDHYRIVARALSPGYLYIVQEDSMGHLDWLFPRNELCPHSNGSNPIRADQQVQVPAAESASGLFLDTTVGVEHVYAVFSASPWPRLEEALARACRRVPAEIKPVAVVTRGVVDAPNTLGMRGVGGVRPDTAPEQRPAPAAAGDRFVGDGSFLVLERWFRHVEP